MASDTLEFTVSLRDQFTQSLDKVNKSLDATAAAAEDVAKASDEKKFGFDKTAKHAGALSKALDQGKRISSGFASKLSTTGGVIGKVRDRFKQFNDESKLNQKLAEMSGQKLTKLGAAAYTAEQKYGKLGKAANSVYTKMKPALDKMAPTAKRAFDGVASGVKAGLDKAKGVLRKFPEAAKNAAAKAGSALKSVGKAALGAAATIVGAGLGIALTKGFSRLQAIEQAQAKLRGLGHDAKSITGLMESANKAVKGTAFGLDEAAGVAATMSAAGVSAGKEMTDTLTLVGDAATIGGSTMSEMGSIFGKVAAKGKLDGEVMNQLLDRQIGLLPALAKHYNVSTEEANKMVSEGKVSFQDFAKVMEETLGGAAQKSGETFSGAFANMKAALGRVGATLLEPFFKAAPGMLTGITGLIDNINEALKPIMESVGDKLAPVFEKIGSAMEAFAEGGMSGLMSKMGDLAPVIAPIAGALAGLATIMGKDLIPFASKLLPVLNPWLGAFIGLTAASPELRGMLAEVATTLAGSLMGAVQGLTPMLGTFMDVLTTLTNDVIKMLVPVVLDLVKVLGPVLGSVIKAVIPIIGVLMGVAMSLVRALLPAIGTILQAVMPIVQALGGLIQAVMPIVGALAPLVAFLAMILIPVIQFLANVVSVVFQGIAWVITGAVNIVTGILNGLVGFFTDKLPGAMSWFQTTVVPIFQAIGSGIMTAFGAVTDWFQNTALPIFQAVWDGIVTGAQWMWTNVLQPIWTVMQYAFLVLVTAIMAAWEFILKPTFQAIATVAQWLWTAVLQPVWNAIKAGWNLLVAGLKAAWEFILKPVWNAIAAAGKWLWENALKPVFGWIKQGWSLLIAGIKLYWETVLKPVWNAVSAAAKWLWTNGVKPVFDLFKAGWRVLGDSIKWVKDHIISPVFRAVKSAGSTMWDGLKVIFDHVKNGIKAVGDGFKLAKDVIKTAWDGIKSAAKGPAEFVVNTVYNKGIRKIWNKAAGIFGMEDKKLPEVKMATGGRVRGPGTGRSDSIDAKLSNGEFVVNADSTRKHLPLLHAINGPQGVGAHDFALRHGTPAFATGGQVGVPAFASGGTLMDATDWWLAKGARGSEHPRFGRVGRHSKNSYHYSGRAVDLNAGPGGENAIEKAFFDKHLAAFKQAFPSIRVIWRAPGHHNHMHIDTSNGADIGEFTGGGGGGGSIFDISPLSGLLSKLTGHKHNAGDFGKGLLNAGKSLVQGALDKINPLNVMDKAGEAMGNVVESVGHLANKAQVKAVAAKYGWATGDQWLALDWLINKESSWRTDAANPNSSARGLFQKMTSIHGPVERTAAGQAVWGLKYIKDRYGSPTAAMSHHRRKNWYADGGQVGALDAGNIGVFDNGGPWEPGTMGVNTSGSTEMVLTGAQSDIVTQGLQTMVQGGGKTMTVQEINIEVSGNVYGVDDLDAYLAEAVEQLMEDIEREWEERR